MKPRTWKIEDLKKNINNSKSIDSLLRSLNLKLTGGNRTTIKRYINQLELDISHFTGQAHRRGSTDSVIPIKSLDEILVENSTYTNTHRLKIRLISEKIKNHICEKCNLKEWLNKKIPLELHHINGIRNDHRIENIILLCPNCHALSDNYRSKNIGK